MTKAMLETEEEMEETCDEISRWNACYIAEKFYFIKEKILTVTNPGSEESVRTITLLNNVMDVCLLELMLRNLEPYWDGNKVYLSSHKECIRCGLRKDWKK